MDENTNLELDYKDAFVRLTADFQNYKKRVEKERFTWAIQAQMDVINPFLSIIDDIERALNSSKAQSEGNTLFAGLELIQKNAEKIVKDLGIAEIDCSGKFNPDLHEALIEVDSPDHTSGDIVTVISKGYMFQAQVLRHAKVSVAK